MLPGLSAFWRLKGKICFFAFFSFQLLPALPGIWPYPPPSKHISLLYGCILTPFSDTYPLASFLSLERYLNIFKDIEIFGDFILSTQIIQRNLSSSRCWTESYLLPYKVTYPQVLMIRTWTSLDGHYSVYHPNAIHNYLLHCCILGICKEDGKLSMFTKYLLSEVNHILGVCWLAPSP